MVKSLKVIIWSDLRVKVNSYGHGVPKKEKHVDKKKVKRKISNKHCCGLKINTLVKKYTYTEHIHQEATKIYPFVFRNKKHEIVD